MEIPGATTDAPSTSSEDRFRALTGSAPVGIYELTLEGRALFANDRCNELIGVEIGPQNELGWLEAIHPDDRDAVIAEWAAASDQQREFELEYRFVHPDGRVVWVFGRAATVVDDDGRPVGFLGTLTDISKLKHAEEDLALRGEIMRNMAEGVCVIRASDGIIVDTNPTFDRMMLYGAGELLGQPVSCLHPERERPADEGSAASIIGRLQSGETISYEAHNVRKDGVEIWCRATTSTYDHPEHGRVWIAVQAEITEQRRARAALAEAEERFRRAFQDSASGMALIEGSGPMIGRFVDVNPALIQISGYSADELLGMSYWDLVHPDEAEEMRAGVAALIAGDQDGFQTEQRMLAAGDEVRWIAFSVSLVRDAAGQPLNAVVQAQDVSERKRFEEELKYLADHDSLTGLFNRRRFAAELDREVAGAARYETAGALLVLDLDDFKLVNDGHGHAAGDDVLRRVAAALRVRLRRTDLLARLGGDEFGIIMPRADEARAVALADEIREVIGQITGPAGERISASVGIATFGSGDAAADGDRIVADADAAMYAAKVNGRDTVRVRAGDTSRAALRIA